MESLEDLVVRAQVGDQEAYNVIVQRFQAMALAYAFSLLGDSELAEDARQEAFVGAYCDLLTLRNPSAFPSWFRRIVHKHSVQIIRGRRILTVPLEELAELASHGPNPAEAAHARDLREKVLQAVDRLPAHEREAVKLYYLEELSLKDISQAQGIPAKTVNSRLHSGRARLRQWLGGMVKKTVQNHHLAGDRRASQSASRTADARGYNVQRSMSGTPGTYQKINAAPVYYSEYVDAGLESLTTYFYIVFIVDVNDNAIQWTPPFRGTTAERENGAGEWTLYR